MSAATGTNSSGCSKRSIRGAASKLENETKAFLQSRASLNRAATYTPTIEELQSVSFTDYVRRTILGVTINTLECNEVTLDKVIGTIDTRKFSDGIAKVTLPLGWWDEEGIGKDRTARGPKWSSESKLGQMVITTPIKQRLSGIGGIYEFTMFELKPQTVADFRLRADQYRCRQLGSIENDFSEEAVEELARQFWRRLGPTMEPSVYGADFEGSLFEGDKASGWNVNHLSSCLQLLTIDHPDSKLPGVTNSYLYFGMWASCFAAHTEDMNLCSINYLHAGAPKYWYSVSTLDAPRFESLAAHHFADAASECAEFLRHKRYLISPAILKKAGIKYKTQVQRPGDAIITFPGSYHFGFNIGFNVAESSNFAIPEWIPQGIHANVCLCRPDSVRIDIERITALLIRYEQYCLDHQHRIPYHDWAALEIERNAKEVQHPPQIDPNPEMLPITYPSRAKNKRSKRKNHKQEIDSQLQHRIAQKASAKQFKKKSQVLYYHPDGSMSCGTVMEVIENHARVNFKGLRKKDDEWIRLDNVNLFLDGGVDPSLTAPNANRNILEKKKRKKMTSDIQSSMFPLEAVDVSSDITDKGLLAPRSVEESCSCTSVIENFSPISNKDLVESFGCDNSQLTQIASLTSILEDSGLGLGLGRYFQEQKQECGIAAVK